MKPPAKRHRRAKKKTVRFSEVQRVRFFCHDAITSTVRTPVLPPTQLHDTVAARLLSELWTARGAITGAELVRTHIESYRQLRNPDDPGDDAAIAALLLEAVRKQLDHLIGRIQHRIGEDRIIIQRYNTNVHFKAEESVLQELIGIQGALNPARQRGHAV